MCAAHSVAAEGLLSAGIVEATKTQCLLWRAGLSTSGTRHPALHCCDQNTGSSRAGFQRSSIHRNRKEAGAGGCGHGTPSLKGEVDMEMGSTKRGSHMPQDVVEGGEWGTPPGFAGGLLLSRPAIAPPTPHLRLQWLPSGPQSENQVGLPEAGDPPPHFSRPQQAGAGPPAKLELGPNHSTCRSPRQVRFLQDRREA